MGETNKTTLAHFPICADMESKDRIGGQPLYRSDESRVSGFISQVVAHRRNRTRGRSASGDHQGAARDRDLQRQAGWNRKIGLSTADEARERTSFSSRSGIDAAENIIGVGSNQWNPESDFCLLEQEFGRLEELLVVSNIHGVLFLETRTRGNGISAVTGKNVDMLVGDPGPFLGDEWSGEVDKLRAGNGGLAAVAMHFELLPSDDTVTARGVALVNPRAPAIIKRTIQKKAELTFLRKF
ncbi:hypothetical protein QBC37DRAFT_484686 [Rhypophila decipiens]|uniref:Uncharacterized protein n=1 Tax=Rhypophila decipiens TaxID=261697 RepID=A0AAN6Y8D6_9PEZI|nr:hypothetical protein QBC37DRAFT_484686 [Rhypophila decipiens]